MSFLTFRQMILADIESEYGAGGDPANADAVLVGDLDWSHEGARMAERDRVRFSSKGRLQQVFGGTLKQLTFNVEVKGSGTAGTPPEFGKLLRMCGLAEEIDGTAGTVTYQPASLENESGVIHYYEDRVLHRLTGVRGTAEITSEAGDVARVSFTLTGHDSDPEDIDIAQLPSPEYDDTVPSTFRGASVSLGGWSPVIGEVSFDLGNNVVMPPDANAASGFGSIQIDRRDPTATINPEAVLVAEKDIIADWKQGNSLALSTGVVGNEEGNRWEISAPASYLREIAPGDRDGIRTRELTLGLAEVAGDDEISIIFS